MESLKENWLGPVRVEQSASQMVVLLVETLAVALDYEWVDPMVDESVNYLALQMEIGLDSWMDY